MTALLDSVACYIGYAMLGFGGIASLIVTAWFVVEHVLWRALKAIWGVPWLLEAIAEHKKVRPLPWRKWE